MTPSHPAQRNVQTIVQLEQEALHSRSTAERISDAITKFIGSILCITLQLLWLAGWIVITLNLVPGVTPCGILTLIVSAEGVLLALVILISQHRLTRQADRRAHLDLQIGLLAEQEMTTVLRLLRAIHRHLGLEGEPDSEEARRLGEETDVQQLASELAEKLPND